MKHPGRFYFSFFICLGVALAPPARADDTAAIRWNECRPELTEIYPEAGERLRCGVMDAPLDHDDPSSATFPLDIVRVAALDSERREGSLFFNPGGPGSPAGEGAVLHALVFALAEADDPITGSQRKIAERFDIVAVEPRGLGSSRPFRCRSDETPPSFNDVSEDRSEQNLQAAEAFVALVARACLGHADARRINTGQTARDMDLVRQALGDEKLNYFGVSYGTWLGSWYARLFPHRVGRMVLDSNMNWTGTFDDAWLANSPARQRVFDNVVLPMAVSDAKTYGLGTDADALAKNIATWAPGVRSLWRGWATPDEWNRREVAIHYLMAARALDFVLKANPGADAPTITAALRVHDFGGDARNNKAAFTRSEQLAEEYFAVPLKPGPLDIPPGDAVLTAVSCNDTDSNPDPIFWRQVGDRYARDYPVGGSAESTQACAYWGGASAHRPPLERLQQGNGVVMVQSEYDQQTPEAGAFDAFRQVPNANMVYLRNDLVHGIFPGTHDCVDKLVGDFLANGQRPGRISTCDTSTRKSRSAHRLYHDMERANEAIDRIHRIRRAAIHADRKPPGI
jgi:pimeloyl-ACP methyl ester carboxylesterase